MTTGCHSKLTALRQSAQPASHAPVLLGVRGGGGRLCQGVPRGPATGLEIPDPRRHLAGPPRKLGRPFHTQIGSTIPDLAARFLFGCDLDHRRCAVRCLSCRHVPEFGRGEDVSSFGSSSAVYFGGMAQECVRWLPGRIGPGLAADPGSVTCGPFRPDLGRLGWRPRGATRASSCASSRRRTWGTRS